MFSTVEGYRNVIKYLETSAEYHTFQLKSGKAFRVVFRGLHPSCDPGLMMEELREMGFEPIQMLPVKTFGIKTMFFVELKHSVSGSTIQ